MNDHMQTGMAEALRLTRAGRLREATAIIQRTLAGEPTTNASVVESSLADGLPIHSGNDATASSYAQPECREAPIEAEFRIIDDPSPSMETAVENVTRTLRTERFSSVRTSKQFVDKTYSNTSGTRAYKLYIPGGYTGQAVPLVVMLHGCTQTAADFAGGTRMNVLAEEGTFLVAYPQQKSSDNSSKCWNWFQSTDQHRDKGEPSLIAGITRQIISEYHVDVKRVYVAGLSSGGAMAVIMAATYPDLYAAVGVHSGLAYGAAHDLPSAFAVMNQGKPQHARQLTEIIPLIAFHGERDTTVAPANADRLLDQWLQAVNAGSGSVRSSGRDVKVERGQVASGYAYTRSIYYDVNGRSIVEHWMVHRAGHAWSGGSPGASYTDPKGPDASAEMVRFFNEHPMRR
jgi:poly(hydroxyalkanoate) depolymerase family esterase